MTDRRTQPKASADTKTSVVQTQADIRKLLGDYGADGFGLIEDRNRVVIAFVLHDRRILFAVDPPDPDTFWIARTPQGEYRSDSAQAQWLRKADRQQWRILRDVIRALLIAVDIGLWTIDEAFLAFVGLPEGGTVGEWITVQLDDVYATSGVPSLLPGAGPTPPALNQGDPMTTTEIAEMS